MFEKVFLFSQIDCNGHIIGRSIKKIPVLQVNIYSAPCTIWVEENKEDATKEIVIIPSYQNALENARLNCRPQIFLTSHSDRDR